MSQWQNSSRISLFLLFFFNKKINIYKCLLKSKKDLYVWLFFSLYELIRGGWSRLRHHGQIHCRQIWHCQGIFNWIAAFLSPVSVMRKIGTRTFRNRVIYHQSGVFTRFSSRWDETVSLLRHSSLEFLFKSSWYFSLSIERFEFNEQI